MLNPHAEVQIDVLGQELGAALLRISRIVSDSQLQSKEFDRRLKRMEYMVKRFRDAAIKGLAEKHFTTFGRRYYNSFLNFARHRKLRKYVQYMCSDSTVSLRKRYYELWYQYRRLALGRKRRWRCVRFLQENTRAHLQKIFFKRWLQWHVWLKWMKQQRRALNITSAATLGNVSENALRRRYFHKMFVFYKVWSTRRLQDRKCTVLGDACLRGVMRRYLFRWHGKHHRVVVRRKHLHAVTVRERQCYKVLMLRYYTLLSRYTTLHKPVRKVNEAVEYIRHHNVLRLLHRYYSSWCRYGYVLRFHVSTTHFYSKLESLVGGSEGGSGGASYPSSPPRLRPPSQPQSARFASSPKPPQSGSPGVTLQERIMTLERIMAGGSTTPQRHPTATDASNSSPQQQQQLLLPQQRVFTTLSSNPTQPKEVTPPVPYDLQVSMTRDIAGSTSTATSRAVDWIAQQQQRPVVLGMMMKLPQRSFAE